MQIHIKTLRRIFLVITMLPWIAVHAVSGIPAGGSLGFTVQREGEDVGTHTIRFEDRDGVVRVDVQTSVNVKLPFVGISVYHFEHQGAEQWRDGALLSLRSNTDDDGEARELKVSREADKLQIESNLGQHGSAGDLIPASLWNPALVKSAVLLNTLDGSEMTVTVTEQERQSVPVQGQMVSARHYVVSGGINRELWYDEDNVLVKVAFSAKDDSKIEYVLK